MRIYGIQKEENTGSYKKSKRFTDEELQELDKFFMKLNKDIVMKLYYSDKETRIEVAKLLDDTEGFHQYLLKNVPAILRQIQRELTDEQEKCFQKRILIFT